jgi:hypothetical protein
VSPNDDPVRQAFEAYMRKQNACVRLARQKEYLGGHYRTVTVQRAWELWQAALSTLPQAAAAVPLSEERYLDALRRIYAAKSIHDARHIVVHTLGTEVMRACGITPPEGASE